MHRAIASKCEISSTFFFVWKQDSVVSAKESGRDCFHCFLWVTETLVCSLFSSPFEALVFRIKQWPQGKFLNVFKKKEKGTKDVIVKFKMEYLVFRHYDHFLFFCTEPFQGFCSSPHPFPHLRKNKRGWWGGGGWGEVTPSKYICVWLWQWVRCFCIEIRNISKKAVVFGVM